MQLFEHIYTHKQATSNSEKRAAAMIVRFRRYLFIHIFIHASIAAIGVR